MFRIRILISYAVYSSLVGTSLLDLGPDHATRTCAVDVIMMATVECSNLANGNSI